MKFTTTARGIPKPPNMAHGISISSSSDKPESRGAKAVIMDVRIPKKYPNI